MNKPPDWWIWPGAERDWAWAALAGALGGLVRWMTLRETWRQGATSLGVGAICAVYLGPLVAPLLKPLTGAIAPDGDSAGFAAFVVGLGGISFAGLLIDLIQARRSQGAQPEVTSETPPQRPPEAQDDDATP